MLNTIHLTKPTTAAEARKQAIDWQVRASEESLSYGELAEAQSHFADLAEQFPELLEEFKENGII